MDKDANMIIVMFVIFAIFPVLITKATGQKMYQNVSSENMIRGQWLNYLNKGTLAVRTIIVIILNTSF